MQRTNRIGWLATVLLFIFVLWMTDVGRGPEESNQPIPEVPASDDEVEEDDQLSTLSSTDTSTLTPNSQSETRSQCYWYRITVFSARVRECPKMSCKVVTGLSQDDEICVLGWATAQQDWVQVQLNGVSEYYVHKSIIEPVDEELEMPVVTLP